jgi:DNA-binding response OmpR family regulator
MKILIVEDNHKLAANTKEGLENAGYACECIHDGLAAEKRIRFSHRDFDLVILDIMLPGKNGIEICSHWRACGITLPVLMLTARDAIDDKVLGLNGGADDYLAKPFAFAELLARVSALLRRPPQTVTTVLSASDVTLDTVRRRVEQNGIEVELTLKEYMVLEYMLRNQNKVITRDDLYSHAWDYADTSFSNTVNVHIKNLRQKLHDDGSFIQTVRGVGYKMEA